MHLLKRKEGSTPMASLNIYQKDDWTGAPASWDKRSGCDSWIEERWDEREVGYQLRTKVRCRVWVLGIDWAKNTGERGRRSGQWIGILILVEGLATEGELSSAWVRWSSSAQLRRYRWSNLVSHLISRYYCKIIKPGGTEGWQHFGSDQRLEDWGNGEHWCNLPHHFSWQWQ